MSELICVGSWFEKHISEHEKGHSGVDIRAGCSAAAADMLAMSVVAVEDGGDGMDLLRLCDNRNSSTFSAHVIRILISPRRLAFAPAVRQMSVRALRHHCDLSRRSSRSVAFS